MIFTVPEFEVNLWWIAGGIIFVRFILMPAIAALYLKWAMS